MISSLAPEYPSHQNLDVASATQELWNDFGNELRAFCLSRTGSAALADDLVQSAFLKAHESLARGTAPENPRAWMYRIVKNLIADSSRTTTRDRNVVERLAQAGAQASVREAKADELGAHESDAFASIAQVLPAFVGALESPYREALMMTEVEGLTQAEAAERAGISLSGMKSRVQRGRAKLYDMLQKCCSFELDARNHVVDFIPRSPCSDC